MLWEKMYGFNFTKNMIIGDKIQKISCLKCYSQKREIVLINTFKCILFPIIFKYDVFGRFLFVKGEAITQIYF